MNTESLPKIVESYYPATAWSRSAILCHWSGACPKFVTHWVGGVLAQNIVLCHNWGLSKTACRNSSSFENYNTLKMALWCSERLLLLLLPTKVSQIFQLSIILGQWNLIDEFLMVWILVLNLFLKLKKKFPLPPQLRFFLWFSRFFFQLPIIIGLIHAFSLVRTLRCCNFFSKFEEKNFSLPHNLDFICDSPDGFSTSNALRSKKLNRCILYGTNIATRRCKIWRKKIPLPPQFTFICGSSDIFPTSNHRRSMKLNRCIPYCPNIATLQIFFNSNFFSIS